MLVDREVVVDLERVTEGDSVEVASLESERETETVVDKDAVQLDEVDRERDIVAEASDESLLVELRVLDKLLVVVVVALTDRELLSSWVRLPVTDALVVELTVVLEDAECVLLPSWVKLTEADALFDKLLVVLSSCVELPLTERVLLPPS